MKLIKYPDRSQWNEILKRPILETENLFDTVRNIINRVRAGGDRVVMESRADCSLRAYAARWRRAEDGNHGSTAYRLAQSAAEACPPAWR